MAPNLFERPLQPSAPRNFDGEVAHIIQEGKLAFGLERISHPGKSTKKLPQELHVGKPVEPSLKEEKKEETFLT